MRDGRQSAHCNGLLACILIQRVPDHQNEIVRPPRSMELLQVNAAMWVQGSASELQSDAPSKELGQGLKLTSCFLHVRKLQSAAATRQYQHPGSNDEVSAPRGQRHQRQGSKDIRPQPGSKDVSDQKNKDCGAQGTKISGLPGSGAKMPALRG